MAYLYQIILVYQVVRCETSHTYVNIKGEKNTNIAVFLYILRAKHWYMKKKGMPIELNLQFSTQY